MKKKVKKVLKKQLKGVSLFVVMLFLIIGLVVGFYLYNITKEDGVTKIELNGSSFITLNVGDEYVEEGYTFVVDGKDYTSVVTVDSLLDTSNQGVYVITYTLNQDGHNITLTRAINVLGGISDGK